MITTNSVSNIIDQFQFTDIHNLNLRSTRSPEALGLKPFNDFKYTYLDPDERKKTTRSQDPMDFDLVKQCLEEINKRITA